MSEVLLPDKQLPSLSSSILLSKRSEEYDNTTQHDTDRNLAIGKTLCRTTSCIQKSDEEEGVASLNCAKEM